MQKCPSCGGFFKDILIWKRRKCPFCKCLLISKSKPPKTDYSPESKIGPENEEILMEEDLFEEELREEHIYRLLDKGEHLLLTGEKFSGFLYVTGLTFLLYLLVPNTNTGYIFLAAIACQVIDFLALASSPNIYLTDSRIIIKDKYSPRSIKYEEIASITHYYKGVFKQSELVIELFNGKQYFLDRIANGPEIEDFYKNNQLNLRLHSYPPIGTNVNSYFENEVTTNYDISQLPIDVCPACGANVNINDKTCPSCGIRFIETKGE